MTTETGPPEALPDDAADRRLGRDEGEVRRLFERLADDPSARDEIAEAFLPLSDYLARRFQGRGEAVEDLIQVARIGLLNAIDRFDMDRGVKFSTYATTTIVGELKHHFRDKGWAVRVPRRLQEVGRRVGRLMGELSNELGRSPTIQEIAERAGVSEEEVLEAMDAQHAYTTASLDAPADDEGRPSSESIGSEDETLDTLEGWATIAPAIRELPLRERRILYLRFFRGQTQTQIAEQLEISQMHVSRLLSRALQFVRERAEGA
jgi:RNA polymerase sigma-B factor